LTKIQKFSKGQIYIFSGMVNFRIEKGKILAIGKEVHPPEEISIPWGKKIPVEVFEDAEIDLRIGENGFVEEIFSPTIPQDWDEFIQRSIQEKPKRITVFGEIDTGKTFFTTYLANKLFKEKVKIAILDCDVGQSDIGPPGTIGLATLEEPVVFLSALKPSAIHFVGDYSPASVLPDYFSGMKKLAEKGLSLSEILIIDTPGWVHGEEGQRFTLTELGMLTPEVAVLLERNKELDYLAKNYPGEKIIRLQVPKEVALKNPNQRKNLREVLSKKYFQNAKKIEFFLGEILKEETLLGEKNRKEGLLVGLLNEERDCLGLGIIRGIDYAQGRISILTPFHKKENVKIIQFGLIYLNPDGSEMSGDVFDSNLCNRPLKPVVIIPPPQRGLRLK